MLQGCGGVVVRLLASHQCVLGSISSSRSRIFTCATRAGRCQRSVGFLGSLLFPPPLHSSSAPYSPRFTLADIRSHSNYSTPLKMLPLHTEVSVCCQRLALCRAVSTRLLAGMWWFFTLIMISSYTANLAAFLTITRMESSIKGVEDLAYQSKVKYGVLRGGSTSSFFQNSNHSLYQRMWAMMSQAKPDVFTATSLEGVERVQRSKGHYAFFMESASIEYETEHRCDLMQIGGLLDQKGYGIALPIGVCGLLPAARSYHLLHRPGHVDCHYNDGGYDDIIDDNNNNYDDSDSDDSVDNDKNAIHDDNDTGGNDTDNNNGDQDSIVVTTIMLVTIMAIFIAVLRWLLLFYEDGNKHDGEFDNGGDELYDEGNNIEDRDNDVGVVTMLRVIDGNDTDNYHVSGGDYGDRLQDVVGFCIASCLEIRGREKGGILCRGREKGEMLRQGREKWRTLRRVRKKGECYAGEGGGRNAMPGEGEGGTILRVTEKGRILCQGSEKGEMLCRRREKGRILYRGWRRGNATPDSPYRTLLNHAILKMAENGVLADLKTKWWRTRGGGKCDSVSSKQLTTRGDVF
ncbi:hypothetical protein PR048_033039 [Dryococelus australis]|uniref:Ionotropic glutamate receptor C-terminal domain-containing protein n=1 Tax=Dryococelus australis TaxID=614101 RepID=A0ABQ9G3X8_9NEOP|nr:hypothetical protein PR048_033039 [Dryococelus australis]